jgi:phosphatidylinositol alpha-1,6-mannosyltransferase
VSEGGPCDTVRDGWNGYLTAATAAALGDALARLLADPSLARDMGANGTAFVHREFRWERGARTLLRVVDKVRTGLQGEMARKAMLK